MDFALKIVIAYLLGAVNGSLVLARLSGRGDIRDEGSGNAGATNALRTRGPLFASGVALIDVGKGWVAAGWLPALVLPGVAPTSAATELALWLPLSCALAAIVGHVWPVWHGFRGGKGAATLVGALIALAPSVLPLILLMWLMVVMVSGYVGLATITAACILPLLLLAASVAPRGPLLVFSIVTAALIVYTHRGNIARVRAGTESRATRLWLFGKRHGAPPAATRLSDDSQEPR